MMKAAVSTYHSPDDFIGGCGQSTKAPRTKLRASWVQTKDEEISLESLMLKPSKKPVDFLGGSSSKGLDVYKHNETPMHDETEKTANSSASNFDLSYDDLSQEGDDEPKSEPVIELAPPAKEEEPAKRTSMAYDIDDFLPGCEPAPIKKWTPPRKDEDSSPNKATHMASAYAQDSYLPGCEPKPIKRWTPPPKEDPSEPPKRMSRTWDQPDEFLGGCEPKPIKKWTPPPKEDPESPRKSKNDISWDHPNQYLGGCEPKAIRRWSKPSN